MELHISSCYLITVVCEVTDCFPQEKINGCILSVSCSVSLCAWKQGSSLFSGCVSIRGTCLSENTLVFLQTGHLQKICISWKGQKKLDSVYTHQCLLVLLNTTVSLLPTRPVGGLVPSRTAQSCLPPSITWSLQYSWKRRVTAICWEGKRAQLFLSLALQLLCLYSWLVSKSCSLPLKIQALLSMS